MIDGKSEILSDEEEIRVLNLNDKTKALNELEVEDIEGPSNEDPLVVTDFLKLIDVAKENKLDILSAREILSGGVFGPIYTFEAKELISGKKIKIVERCFSEIKDVERRFASVNVSMPWRKDSEPRYEIRNNKNENKNRLIIDYLYNEEQALKNLQGIKGIPAFYGAVYDELNGSILEEYIDGPDLSMLLLRDKKDRQEWDVMEIFEKLKQIYIQAAEVGYIHNDPSHSTVMLDKKSQQPYLADWYLCSRGNIEADGPIKDKYVQGLKEIEDLKKDLLEVI
ncbi:MAG: serine/threonine-protein kinase [Patescibacteria group bacterium]|nr:serine/threonine-protein kinase [Patescibacteria group bacterium]